jgi:hypothetical protein
MIALDYKTFVREGEEILRTVHDARERSEFMDDRRHVVSVLRDQLLGKGVDAASNCQTVRTKTVDLLSQRLACQEISCHLLMRITDALAKSAGDRPGPVLKQSLYEEYLSLRR